MRAVLFDYGHTLVDFHRTEEALAHAYQRVHELVVDEVGRTASVPGVGALVEDLVGAIDRLVAASYEERRLEELDILGLYTDVLAGLGLELSAGTVRRIVALDHLAFRSCITLPDETAAVLDELRRDGYALGFVSNAHLLPDLLREDLDHLGLAERLDAGTFSSEVGTRKPDPAIFHHVLDELGVAAEDAVFVGDRVRDDIAGARDAGFGGAVLTHQWRREEPDGQETAVISRLSELPRLMGGW